MVAEVLLTIYLAATAAFLVYVIVKALRTGTVTWRGMTDNRTEAPRRFWLTVSMLIVLVIAFLFVPALTVLNLAFSR